MWSVWVVCGIIIYGDYGIYDMNKILCCEIKMLIIFFEVFYFKVWNDRFMKYFYWNMCLGML